MTEQTIKEGKGLAIVSYLTLIGTLIAFIINNDKKNPFTSFHIRQALGLWLLEMLIGYFIGGFDSWMITLSFWAFFMILFFYGILGAVTGKLYSVPVLGPFFQKLFASIGK
ncbi:hypothetical protein [Mangrovimonas sp. YM274]|uniref:hypothetical protein n=1 Tax=Mangrovimonas sp. YM274 TaxID=3070660 RepID=UPI0027DD4656|nr:hypothetical protein [Mangrovimonas sp. YM274]WMI67225.1 hypothetical protein RBH95_08710 [Mangrovimonas sp. YM274]